MSQIPNPTSPQRDVSYMIQSANIVGRWQWWYDDEDEDAEQVGGDLISFKLRS